MGRTARRSLLLPLLAALLLGAAEGPAAAQSDDPPIPGATWDAKAYEDHVLGFRLERLPEPWTVREWNGAWNGPLQPVVAFGHPTGSILAVYARDAGEGSEEACAGALAADLAMSAPPAGSLRPTEVDGSPGVQFSFHVLEADDRRPVHAFVAMTLKEGVCFALVTFADAKDRLPKFGKELLDRFHFLPEGGFRRKEPPLDVEGAGWRTRGGTAEHAFVGVRIPLGAGWRLALPTKVPTSFAYPSLNLECPFLGVSVRLQGIAFEDADWERLEAAAKEEFDLRYVIPRDAVAIHYAVDGTPVHFNWRLVRRRSPTAAEGKSHVLCGTLRGDRRLILVEVFHPRARDPRVPVAIEGILRDLHVLTPEERAGLVATMGSQPESQAYVGAEEFLRKGAWVSYAHRIVWKKPSALWTFLPRGNMLDPGELLAVLLDEEHGTNARLMSFETGTGDTKWTLHQRVVDGFHGVFKISWASKTNPTSLGSRDSLRTDLRTTIAGIPLRFTLITTNPIGPRTYALVVASRDEAGAADAALDAAVKNLRFQVAEIPGPRRMTRGWEDPGFGFKVEVPTGTFRAESLPVQFAPVGGTVVNIESGPSRLVVAAREWPLGEPEMEKAAILRVLTLLDPRGASARLAAGTDSASTLGGLPSRARVYPATADSPEIRIVRLRAAGALFVVGAPCAAAGETPAALGWFRLAE